MRPSYFLLTRSESQPDDHTMGSKHVPVCLKVVFDGDLFITYFTLSLSIVLSVFMEMSNPHDDFLIPAGSCQSGFSTRSQKLEREGIVSNQQHKTVYS